MTPEERAREALREHFRVDGTGSPLHRGLTAAIRAAEDAAISRASQACRSYAQSEAVTDEVTRFTANYCADFIECLRSDA